MNSLLFFTALTVIGVAGLVLAAWGWLEEKRKYLFRGLLIVAITFIIGIDPTLAAVNGRKVVEVVTIQSEGATVKNIQLKSTTDTYCLPFDLYIYNVETVTDLDVLK